MKNLLFYIIWPVIAGLVFAGVILAVTGGFQDRQFPDQEAPVQEPGPVTPRNPGIADFSFKDAISKAAPAVVSINFQKMVNSPGRNLYFPQLRARLENAGIDNSQGSGVIISPDGYIITSYHIFNTEGRLLRPPELSITLQDGRVLEPRPVAVDEANDLVLLKVEETDLPYLRIGTPRPLSQGDIVLAIGYPKNLGQSASQGIISALLKTGDSYLIQTDASINPGNSGGALIDYQGNLIGINSTIVSESGGSEGIGFATPADKAIYLMNAFLESGSIGYLGITVQLVPLRSFNMNIGGYRVDEVTENSPAFAAGIKEGDIITQINDVMFADQDKNNNFLKTLISIKPGEQVSLKVFREGEFLTLTTVLGKGEGRPFFELNPEDSAVTLNP